MNATGVRRRRRFFPVSRRPHSHRLDGLRPHGYLLRQVTLLFRLARPWKGLGVHSCLPARYRPLRAEVSPPGAQLRMAVWFVVVRHYTQLFHLLHPLQLLLLFWVLASTLLLLDAIAIDLVCCVALGCCICGLSCIKIDAAADYCSYRRFLTVLRVVNATRFSEPLLAWQFPPPSPPTSCMPLTRHACTLAT